MINFICPTVRWFFFSNSRLQKENILAIYNGALLTCQVFFAVAHMWEHKGACMHCRSMLCWVHAYWKSLRVRVSSNVTPVSIVQLYSVTPLTHLSKFELLFINFSFSFTFLNKTSIFIEKKWLLFSNEISPSLIEFFSCIILIRSSLGVIIESAARYFFVGSRRNPSTSWSRHCLALLPEDGLTDEGHPEEGWKMNGGRRLFCLERPRLTAEIRENTSPPIALLLYHPIFIDWLDTVEKFKLYNVWNLFFY